MNTKQKGDMAEGQAINYFIMAGYEVCLPVGNKTDYDFIIEKDKSLQTVQVKFAGLYPSKGNVCRVGLRITGGNQSYNYSKKYSDDAFDILFVYTAKGQRFVIPWSEITARNELYIEHTKYAKYEVKDTPMLG